MPRMHRRATGVIRQIEQLPLTVGEGGYRPKLSDSTPKPFAMQSLDYQLAVSRVVQRFQRLPVSVIDDFPEELLYALTQLADAVKDDIVT